MPAVVVVVRGGARIVMTLRGPGLVVLLMVLRVARVGICTGAIMVTLYAEGYEDVKLVIMSGKIPTHTGAGLGDGLKPGDLCIHEKWLRAFVVKRNIPNRAWHSRAGTMSTMTVTTAMLAVTTGV
jgi:hypothetical protein